MIFVRNKAVATTPLAIASTGAFVPFDTVVMNTNGNLALSGNAIQEKASGVYDTILQVDLSNTGSASVTAVVQAYADGTAIAGATRTVTIGASETAPVSLEWPVNVVAAASGTANISWFVSGGAVNLANANAQVYKHI